ncbi:MAG TPA: hypothetical protein VNU46_02985 [Gemmatimonadaceae bacterium]|jgi:hypothetical protein|nr:hypothetical protein [Gemmatimonadaceae bacterium]
MIRSSPKSKEPTWVILIAVAVLPLMMNLLEGGYAPWPRSLLDAIRVFLPVYCSGYLIYLLCTEWGALIAQYRPQALFRDRAFTFQEVIGTGIASLMAVLLSWAEPKQTWLGPWDRALRVGFALVLVIVAIPGFVHMWVVLKNRRS